MYYAVRRNRTRQPDVAANDRVMTDHSVTAQYCRPCVNNNIILNIGMPFDAFYEVPLFINGKTLCAKGYALVYLDIVPYNACLAYYNACAMVNEKYSPIEAPGCMSIPVLVWAYSDIILGIIGTLCL